MITDYNKDVDVVIGLIQKVLGFYKKNPPLNHKRKVVDGKEYVSWWIDGLCPYRDDYYSIDLLSDGSVIIENYRIPLRHIKSLDDLPRYVRLDLPYKLNDRKLSYHLCAGLSCARSGLERIADSIDNYKPPKNKNSFFSKLFG